MVVMTVLLAQWFSAPRPAYVENDLTAVVRH